MEKVNMNGNRTSGIQLFLTGLGTGIALTLLLAPLSGAATRRLIGRKVREGEDWMKDTATTAREYVQTRGAGLREGIKEAAEVLARG